MAIRSTAVLVTLALAAALQAEPAPPGPDAAGRSTIGGALGGPFPLTAGAPGEPIPHTPPTAASSQYWAGIEYLYWCVQGPSLPPLVTTSAPGTPAGQAGVLGAPATGLLYGGERLDEDPRSGLRLTAGVWLDECRTWGAGFEFFCLEDPDEKFAAGSPGSPILARPFFNTLDQSPDAQITAFPGLAAGGVTVDLDSKLWGAGAFCRKVLCADCTGSLEALVGYRYLDLDERLVIVEQIRALALIPGATFTLNDTFDARTRFHGADFGLAARANYGRCYVDVLGKVAVGCNDREVSISGATVAAVPGQAPTVASAGLLTIGGPARETDQVFAVVPEFRFNVGYQVSDCARVFVGYSVLGWTNVARAGEQIDLRVNPNQIAPALVPVPTRDLSIRDTTLWMHGINLGVAVSY